MTEVSAVNTQISVKPKINYEDMKAEDFFKTDKDCAKSIKERKDVEEESQCSLNDEDRTTLSETQFMMCLQCN